MRELPQTNQPTEIDIMSSYKMRNNSSIGNDGHVMKTGGEDTMKTMIGDKHELNIEVRIDWRNRLMSSGTTKRGIGTRKCFDTNKNYRLRELSNIGIVTSHGTTTDTRKASDGDFKNSRCKTLTEIEKKKAKRDRFVEKIRMLRNEK